jgi:hypothetical protein
MAFDPTMGSSTGDRSRSISEGQARRPRLRQLHQPPPTPAGALRRQMTDSLVDGVQVDLVGRFPAGAGDVPGPNAQPGHRGSMAEPVSPGSAQDSTLVAPGGRSWTDTATTGTGRDGLCAVGEASIDAASDSLSDAP